MSATDFMPDGTKSVTCMADGCGREVKARRLCSMHYARQRRTGDVNTVRRAGRPCNEANAQVHRLFAEWSPRTRARYIRAWRMFAVAKVEGYDIDDHEALQCAIRPNGSVNVARFRERAAEARLLFAVVAGSDQ